jgi:acetyl-CoA synthetase
VGWVTGHSYLAYGPLLNGATALMYEGAPLTPQPDRFWSMIARHCVSVFYTAPTAIRTFMRLGDEHPRKHDLSSLRLLGTVGEPINPEAWRWYRRVIGGDRCPIVDTWWQTETGAIMISPLPGATAAKPGSATLPLPGIDAAVVNPSDGRAVAPGEKGIVVLRRPFPGLTPSLWGEPERYAADYWQRLPDVWWTGDSASVDEDGYVFFAGRADEIIKCAGHKLGTIEVETALLTHPAVAEAGVTGRPDPLRGEVVAAFVALRQGHAPSAALREELIRTVRRELGPVAVVGDLEFVQMLPKTRSGKIMRRVLRAVTLDRDPGDVSTIEDEGSVDEARRAWAEMRAELGGGAPGAHAPDAREPL